jgi:hypothetical protein
MRSRLILLAFLLWPAGTPAASLPPIVVTADNAVPKCVRPDALMDFVHRVNERRATPRTIAPRFDHIASLYQHIGQCVSRPPDACVGVRWDYAFYQMLIETNYLTFRRPDGALAGVPASDNNFAGIGATVSGRPGEHFDSVQTGVLAHLQHVLMYSATPIPHPIAKRTRLVQNDVQAIMRRLHRPVTFADLAREWTGIDQSGYARDMRHIADEYSERYCRTEQLTER